MSQIKYPTHQLLGQIIFKTEQQKAGSYIKWLKNIDFGTRKNFLIGFIEKKTATAGQHHVGILVPS